MHAVGPPSWIMWNIRYPMMAVVILCIAVAVFDAYDPGIGDQSSIETTNFM